jgi:hypothetical protein
LIIFSFALNVHKSYREWKPNTILLLVRKTLSQKNFHAKKLEKSINAHQVRDILFLLWTGVFDLFSVHFV